MQWNKQEKKILMPRSSMLSIPFFHAAVKSEHTNTNTNITQWRFGIENRLFVSPKENTNVSKAKKKEKKKVFDKFRFWLFWCFQSDASKNEQSINVHFKGGFKWYMYNSICEKDNIKSENHYANSCKEEGHTNKNMT